MQYTYDPIGQRISKMDTRGNQTTPAYSYHIGTREKIVPVTLPALFAANTTIYNQYGGPTSFTDMQGITCGGVQKD